MDDLLRRAVPPKLRAALAAAGRGWPVFPVFPGSKRPAIGSWQHHATTDPAALSVWWRHVPYNVGIACGPAGLLVVDLDRPHGTALELAAVLALLQDDPTYTVETPRGEHRYYIADESTPLRSTAGQLAAGVDTRGAGGFVLAAGSTRRLDGRLRRYRVISPPGVGPRPLPERLRLALGPSSGALRSPAPADVSSLSDAYLRAAVAGEVARVRDAMPGRRNTALFTVAVHLGRLAGAGLLNEDDVAGSLTKACGRHVGVDGFTAAEADRAIANGLRYGRRRPRAVPAPPVADGR
jgi:hypothetical protein